MILVNFVHIYFFISRNISNNLTRISIAGTLFVIYLLVLYLRAKNTNINPLLELINIIGLISLLFWMTQLLEDLA